MRSALGWSGTIRCRVFRHCSLQSLLETTAALRHVTGSPGLGLLRRLRPVPDRSADGVPSPSGHVGDVVKGADQGRFPCSLIDRSTEEAPDSTLRHRRGYPAARHPGLPSVPPTSRGVPRPRDEGDGCASRPAQIRQVRAGASLRGVERRFLAYAFPSRSPHPRRLAVPTPHGFVGAACHPAPAPPGPGCPQLHRPAATGRRRRSLTSTQSTSASRRTGGKTHLAIGHVEVILALRSAHARREAPGSAEHLATGRAGSESESGTGLVDRGHEAV